MAMLIIGHRGARGLAPENTLAAIQKCLDLGNDGVAMIEIDVRVTRDGVPVLHHNRLLRDRSDNLFDIRKHTFAELKRHKSDLPSLADALGLIDNQLPVYLEVKPGEHTNPVIAVILQYVADRNQSDRILLASKSQKTLRALHEELPNLQTIVIEPWSGVRATYRARQLGTNMISMNYLWLWSGFIRLLSRRGYKLIAYTVNDQRLARRWQRSGLAGICTDYPNVFARKR